MLGAVAVGEKKKETPRRNNGGPLLSDDLRRADT
jgi:hypothetical protein